MRKNWKKLVSLVLTAACTMVVTVAPVFADAASTPAYSPVEASTVDSLLSSSAQWVGQSLMTYSDDDLANMEASDQQFYARAAEAWEEAKADLGEVKSLEDDMELQAVITAAIAMYEEDMASASGDAYVARPIRRKGKRA